MSFELFDKIGGEAFPKVTIRSNGEIGLGRGAINTFGIGDYNYCRLYYDEEQHKIGLEFTNDFDGKTCVKVRRGQFDCFLRIRPFLGYYAIDCKISKTYIATKDADSGYIIIDLKTPYHIRNTKEKSEKRG